MKVAASTVWEILKEAGIDPPERSSSTCADFLRSLDDTIEQWPDGRIWSELDARFGTPVTTGPTADRSCPYAVWSTAR
ncbi:hypothetical protein ACWC9U_32090 [Streptomyces sp. 900116325]